MNHLQIALSAGPRDRSGAILLLLVLGSRRSRRQADERVGEVVETLEARMDELAQELSGAVERAEDGDAGAAASSERSPARSTSTRCSRARSRPRSRCRGWTPRSSGSTPARATRSRRRMGFEGDEPDPLRSRGPPDGCRLHAIEVLYHYAAERVRRARGSSAAASPCRSSTAGSRSAGSASTRGKRGARFGDEDVRRLEELAERAAPAIENARRFREARQLADLDALTGLHNRRYFHETLAARDAPAPTATARRLALVVFDVDDFKAINDRIGHLAGDAVLAEAADRLREVVRTPDIPCRVGGDEFAVIVPEAGIERGRAALGADPPGVRGRSVPACRAASDISAGLAELQPQDDANSLFQRADEAMYAGEGSRRAAGLTAADAG